MQAELARSVEQCRTLETERDEVCWKLEQLQAKHASLERENESKGAQEDTLLREVQDAQEKATQCQRDMKTAQEELAQSQVRLVAFDS